MRCSPTQASACLVIASGPAARQPRWTDRWICSWKGCREATLCSRSSPRASPQVRRRGSRLLQARATAVRAEAARLWDEVARRAPEAERLGVLVCEKLTPLSGSPAAETLLSVKLDPAFGQVLVLGLGGVLTEWFAAWRGVARPWCCGPGACARGSLSAARLPPSPSVLPQPAACPAATGPRPVARRWNALARVARGLRGAGGEPHAPHEGWALGGRRWQGPARRGAGPAGARRPLRKIASLLSPRSAAVVGASATSLNPGRIILRNLKQAEGLDYGHLHAIHAKESGDRRHPVRPERRGPAREGRPGGGGRSRRGAPATRCAPSARAGARSPSS